MRARLRLLLVLALLPIYWIASPVSPAYAAVGDTDSSINFNGTSTAFQVADTNTLDISNAITMEAWVKPIGINTSSAYMVLNKENSYELYISSGYWIYALQGSSWAGVNTGIAAISDEWQHIAAVRPAGTNTVYFYYNGVLTDTGTADGAGTGSIRNNSEPFQIGARSSSVGSGFSSYFKGEIDEVRVYSAARTAAEIASDMNNYGPVNTTGLVMYFDMNDYGGSTLVNRSTAAGKGPDLTPYNSPTSVLNSIESSTVYSSTKVTRFLRTYLSVNGWKVPVGVRNVRILLVGGGGGGGSDEGGGGGGGGFVEQSNYAVTPNAVVDIEVGGGGSGAISGADADALAGNDGEDSIFGSLIAYGGGGGGSGLNTNGLITRNGRSGGSGGGGGGEQGFTAGTAGAGTAGQGFAGGAGLPGGTYRGGGGGGAGEAGNTDGNSEGGDGLSSTIENGVTAVYYAGGGGGGGGNSGPGVTSAALGGGGVGGGSTTISTDGDANTGGGGGGGTSTARSFAGFAGGSGIIIISYSAFSGEIASISGASYRASQQIVVTASVAGKVTFYAQGKVIPGCSRVSTVSSATITATCNWKPGQRGSIVVSAKIFPTSSPGLSSSLGATTALVGNRSGNR